MKDNIFEELFTFPIVMVDGNEEEMKKNMGSSQEDPDLIIGEIELPYYDFVSVSDRWLPTVESLEKAKEGIFNTCYVVFNRSGGYVVPWPKKKFKKELKEFINNLPEPEPEYKTIELTKDEAIKFFQIDDIKKDKSGDKK